MLFSQPEKIQTFFKKYSIFFFNFKIWNILKINFWNFWKFWNFWNSLRGSRVRRCRELQLWALQKRLGRPPVVGPARAAGTTSSGGPRRSGWDDLQLWAPQKRLGRPPVWGPLGRPELRRALCVSWTDCRRQHEPHIQAAPPTYHLVLPQRINNLGEID